MSLNRFLLFSSTIKVYVFYCNRKAITKVRPKASDEKETKFTYYKITHHVGLNVIKLIFKNIVFNALILFIIGFQRYMLKRGLNHVELIKPTCKLKINVKFSSILLFLIMQVIISKQKWRKHYPDEINYFNELKVIIIMVTNWVVWFYTFLVKIY